jgi:hypothetical protein
VTGSSSGPPWRIGPICRVTGWKAGVGVARAGRCVGVWLGRGDGRSAVGVAAGVAPAAATETIVGSTVGVGGATSADGGRESAGAPTAAHPANHNANSASATRRI